MFFMNPLYWLIATPGLILGLFAQYRVKSAFDRYSKVSFRNRMTGAEVARAILQRNRIDDVKIEEVRGFLSDHYDPRSKTLRLSTRNYGGNSVAAAGIAAHEVGHALQHATGYAPLNLRSALVPVQSAGSKAWIWLFLGGAILSASPMGRALMLGGILVFSVSVLFSVITLPVEFNASARALVALRESGILDPGEEEGARSVLNAAFLTYVAAVVTAAMQLVYLLLRSRLLRAR